MGEEIKEGEKDGEGFLHAEEAVEGPFAMELDDGFGIGDALRGDYVLAGVVALGGAVPEEETVKESYDGLDGEGRMGSEERTDGCPGTVLMYADLDAPPEFGESIAN